MSEIGDTGQLGEVVEISAAETHPLRTAVLRDNDPARPVAFDNDDHPDALHLGVRDRNGAIVAISSWMPNPLDASADDVAIQLRGMAIAAAWQGRGIGGVLFETGIERAARRDFTLAWARARDSALGFYVRHGCTVIGDGFIDDTTRLAHHIVIRRLAPPAPIADRGTRSG